MKRTISSVLVLVFLLSFTQCKKNCIKSESCRLAPDPGQCLASFTRYYYDQNEKKCKQFIYGGCDGQVPFMTLADCEKQCDCK